METEKQKPKKSNKKPPSLKQKRFVAALVDNPRKSLAEAAREAGYSENTVRNPEKNITSRASFQELLDQVMPREEAMSILANLTRKKQRFIIPGGKHGEPDVIITDEPDTQAASAGLTLYAKIHGAFKPTDVSVSLSEGTLAAILGASAEETKPV